MTQILAHSLDGTLRFVQISKTKARVELRSPFYPGDWVWCVQRYFDFDYAMALFEAQCTHHNSVAARARVVEPGV